MLFNKTLLCSKVWFAGHVFLYLTLTITKMLHNKHLWLTSLGGETAPWYILFYNFLVTDPNFMESGDFS